MRQVLRQAQAVSQADDAAAFCHILDKLTVDWVRQLSEVCFRVSVPVCVCVCISLLVLPNRPFVAAAAAEQQSLVFFAGC